MTTIVNNGKYTVRVAVPGVQGSPYESAEAQAATEAARDEALGYKNQAEAFATSASSSASGALSSENKAKQWAEELENTEVEPGQYSALHHKEKAIDAQTGAETAQSLAEGARDDALIYKNDAEAAQGLAEGARDDALTYKNDAEAALLSILDYRGGIPI